MGSVGSWEEQQAQNGKGHSSVVVTLMKMLMAMFTARYLRVTHFVSISDAPMSAIRERVLYFENESLSSLFTIHIFSFHFHLSFHFHYVILFSSSFIGHHHSCYYYNQYPIRLWAG